jgi:YidC/Oxa1 family membrane protein insertase
MAVVFYIQQKYMATPTMQTDQAKQQQKIMMFMMLLFPIFLYKAPSGLTLYILTSTFVGIIESKRVRQHIKEQEEAGTLFKPKKEAKRGGLWDRLQKAAEHRDQRLQGRQSGRRKKR